MREPVSPLVSTSLSLRILRRLLDDETLVASQLSYLVENIHNPLRAGLARTGKDAPIPGSSTTTEDEDVDAMRTRLRSSAVISQLRLARAAQQQRDLAASQGAGRADSSDEAAFTTPVAVDPGSHILSAEQHWGLFANIASLYRAQLVVLAKLVKAVHRLTALLERLQYQAEALELDDSIPETGRSSESSPAATLRQMTELNSSPGDVARAADRPHSLSPPSAPSAATAMTAPGTTEDGGYHELASILSDLFTGEWVSHYAAEHMTYAAQFTTKIAPKVLELSRMWRWGASEASGAYGTVSNSSVVSLPNGMTVVSGAAVLRAFGHTPGRNVLTDYAMFIDYIYRSFAPTGVPQDIRVSHPAMPEYSEEVRRRRLCAETPEVDLFASASSQARRATAAPPIRPGSFGPGSRGAPAAKPGELPSMAADWPGFEALLMLLVTPLASLRRQHHACRCILESGALLREGRRHLTKHYIDVMATQLTEEIALSTNELGQIDVAHVVQLLDDVSTDDLSLRGVLQRLRSGSVSSSGTFTRMLIHYGRLKKRYGRGGRHERLVLLFSDCFCYAEESRSGRLRPRGGASLDAVHVLDVPEGYEDVDVENALELVLRPATKRLIFYADTPEQKWQWVEAIRFASRQYRRWQSQQRKAGSTASVTSSSTATAANMNTEAVAICLGENPLPQRPCVFSDRSRLGRQQRSDQRWQEFLETQRFLATSAAGSPAVSTGALGAAATVPLSSEPVTRKSSVALPNSTASRLENSPGTVTTLPAPVVASASEANLGHPSSFNSSFAATTAASASVPGSLQRSHTQIEYDITPWSHQTSAMRRLRSQESGAMAIAAMSVSCRPNMTDTDGVGDGQSAVVSPARTTSGGVGKPPTGSAAAGSPLRVPLMDRVDPTASAAAVSVPLSPGGGGSGAVCAAYPRRPRTAARSGSSAAISPNRALRFDSASRGGGTEDNDDGSVAATPDPQDTPTPQDGQDGESPEPTPVEGTNGTDTSAVAPHFSSAEYDKDLEKLMNEHFEASAASPPHTSATHSSNSTLIEDDQRAVAAPTPESSPRTRLTPEEAVGLSQGADPARPSSTVSEGHSTFHYDEDDDTALVGDDSVVAVTAFASPRLGEPFSAFAPLSSHSGLLPNSPHADGDVPSDQPEPNASSQTQKAPAPQAHVDPNARLSLDTKEL